MKEPKILVTAELIAKYRATVDLMGGRGLWADTAVQGYAVALSRRLTIAVMMDWSATIADITTILALCEPLEKRTGESYEGSLLWVAYTHYCLRDANGTRSAVATALQRFPASEEFQRLSTLLESSK